LTVDGVINPEFQNVLPQGLAEFRRQLARALRRALRDRADQGQRRLREDPTPGFKLGSH